MKLLLGIIVDKLLQAIPKLMEWIYEEFEARKERKKVQKRNKKVVEDIKNAKTKDETRDNLNRLP